MSLVEPSPAVDGPPLRHTAFGLQVLSALANLTDVSRLQTHTLASYVHADATGRAPSAGATLRQHLLDAIESLRPATAPPASAAGWRSYRLLTMRYVEGRDVVEVQRALAVSKSEYYREHRRAADAVVSVLLQRWGVQPHVGLRSSPADSTGPRRETLAGLRRAHRLPTPLTTFFGREREAAEASELLCRARLLTLTGPPGTGKTRLALTVAAEAGQRYRDGVCFVALDAVTDAEQVLPTIARALEIREYGGSSLGDNLVAALHDRELLLVLDNFEQVVNAAPSVVALLEAAPSVRALVTSRVRLHVQGEQELPVPPLGTPSLDTPIALERLIDHPAVALFVDRARAVRADFALTEANAAAVTRICAILDGLPLAIELAAARVKVLSPPAMLARLEQGFDLLADSARDRPRRQQSLHRAIAGSYDLLDAAEQALFRRLAVFAGGCTMEAIEAVVEPETSDGDARGPASGAGPRLLDELAVLVDSSLVRVEETPGPSTRFSMLETIRSYAATWLAESGELDRYRSRHADYYLRLVESREAELASARLATLERVGQEHENLRGALGWLCAQRQTERALRLAGALSRFWWVKGYFTEGQAWLSAALALPGATARTRHRARALNALGELVTAQGDERRGRDLFAAALAIFQEVGEQRSVALCLQNLGRAHLNEGDHGAALVRFEAALAIARALDDDLNIARSLVLRGHVASIRRDFATARACWEEARARYLDLGGRGPGDFHALLALGSLATDEGRFDEAHALLAQALLGHQQIGHLAGVAQALEWIAGLAAAEGRPGRAWRLAGAAAALRDALGAPRQTYQTAELEQRLAPARAAVDDPTATRAWDEGRGLSLDAAISYALEPDY